MYAWFESIADRRVDRGKLWGRREISQAGTKDLPFAKDSITGYTVIKAENLDKAAEIARHCLVAASTTQTLINLWLSQRVEELKSKAAA